MPDTAPKAPISIIAAHEQDVAQHLESWRMVARQGEDKMRVWMEETAAEEPGRSILAGIFGNSPFLSKILLKRPEILQGFLKEGADGYWQQCFVSFTQQLLAAALEADTARVMQALRQAKAEVALTVALADLTGSWALPQVTQALSQFADLAVETGVRHLLALAHKRDDIALADPQNPTVSSGLIVLGMGKLGAHELNYSSDIDLIVFYEKDRLGYKGRHNEQKFFSKLAQDLVHLLQERTAEGYVFRTDLRLRPDPASTPPAVTTDAALYYYESVGQNWERAAMIKARPVAGDIEAGERFLHQLTPYMWRRSLDFAAIQDILSIKRQINHRTGTDIALPGHNVKLGIGGIREIEFFVQLHQLIWGGREPLLRSRGTLQTLEALVSLKHVKPAQAKVLTEAYHYLRTLEHRLQMVEDQQTHSLPTTEQGMQHIAHFMGFAQVEAFTKMTAAHLEAVHDIFIKSFDTPGLAGDDGNLVFTGVSHDPDTLGTLARMGFQEREAVSEAIMGWHHGRRRCTRTKRARQLLTELVPAILKHLSATANPDFAFRRFDEFLSRLPAGVQVFSLFSNNPQLLKLIADIVGSAPTLSDTLSRYPNLLESVLFADFFDTLPDKQELSGQLQRALALCDHFDAKMELLRQFKNEKQFQAGVQLLQGVIHADKSGPFLSDLADVLIVTACDLTLSEYQQSYGEMPGGQFCIASLGKLGSQELTFGSDVDLLFVYDVPKADRASASVYYNRFCRRLISALTTIGANGRLYEVDTRLRPSGEQGLLTVSQDAFRQYFDEMAWTFEFMALAKARVINAGGVLAKEVDNIIAAQLQKPRDAKALAADVEEMRGRVEKEYSSANPWDIKYVRGGLMDIDFLAQYLVLAYAHDHPALLQRRAADIFEAARTISAVENATLTALINANDFLIRLFNLLRLTTADQLSFENAPEGLKRVLCKNMGMEDFPSLETKLLEVENGVREAYVKLLPRPL